MTDSEGVRRAELEVTAIAAGGRGVARLEGEVWFVAGAIPGDRVTPVGPVRRRPRFAEVDRVRLLHPSADRRPAPCPVQQRCGGCPWMVATEQAQHAYKDRLVRDALERIGRVAADPLEPIRAPEPVLGYRTKIELAARLAPGRAPVVGLHERGAADELVDLERCLLQDETGNALLGALREALAEVPVDHEFTGRVALRRSAATGERLVALFEGPRPWPAAETLAERLVERFPGLAGVALVGGRGPRRGGARVRALSGRSWLAERVAGFELELPAATFLQVHPAGSELLVRLVGELAGPPAIGGELLDLYGGVGLFGLHLARLGARRVDVWDADGDALECGRRAARRAGLGRVGFRRGDVARLVAEDRRALDVDLVVADPPRAGLGPGVTRALARSRLRRLVLVACDPATLARDVGRLARDGGFELRRAIPIDLFPQTAHVETVALLER